jgi:hypothetical protein
MEYLGAWGTLIHEKNLKWKISCQTPFKYNSEPFLELDHERGELGEQDLGGGGTELGVSLQQVAHQLYSVHVRGSALGLDQQKNRHFAECHFGPQTLYIFKCYSSYRFSAALFIKMFSLSCCVCI